MKLARKDIQKAAKALASIPYNPVRETCYIAVLIEPTKTCDFEGIELSLKNTEIGVKRAPEPVLLMNPSEKNPVTLGFADTMYAKHFDIFDYCELLNASLPKGIDILDGVEVVLIDKTNVFLSFEL